MNWDVNSWDTADWVIAGCAGFALLIGFNALKLSASRLRGRRKVWK